MPVYHVFSPEHMTAGSYGVYDYDPPEYGCDVVEVETDSARSALLLGVKEMQRQGMGWVQDNRSDGLPPWAGIKVERVDNLADYGPEPPDESSATGR
jgi:hypothetical protein